MGAILMHFPPTSHCAALIGRDGQGRPCVRINGQIDVDTVPELEHSLTVVTADCGIVLDLSGVDFMDCSGVNLLLRLRERAPAVVLVAPRPMVRRILDVTGARVMFEFAAPGPAAQAS